MSILDLSKLRDLLNPDERPRSFGYLKDPVDLDDRLFSELAGLSSAIPPDASVDSGVVVKDQDGTSSCVGQAVAQALRLAYMVDGKQAPDLSASYVYYNARRNHYSTVADIGTYIRSAMKMVIKLGVPEESLCPFVPSKINSKPSWDAYRYAFQHRGIRGYYRIPSGDVDAVRKSLANRKPVVAGWKVDKAFQSRTGPDVIDAITKDFIGGHAMVIVAYDNASTFTLLNSWGRTWRRNGRQRVSEDFIRKAYDCWSIDVG